MHLFPDNVLLDICYSVCKVALQDVHVFFKIFHEKGNILQVKTLLCALFFTGEAILKNQRPFGLPQVVSAGMLNRLN